MSQLKKDSEFLSKNNIIDYSLLCGIHVFDADNISAGKNVIEDGLNFESRRKNFFSTLSPHKNYNTQSNIKHNNDFKQEFFKNELNLVECKSVGDMKKENLNFDNEDIKAIPSDYSLYNRDINYSEVNDSINEIVKKETIVNVII